MDNSILLKIKNELDIVDIVSESVDLSKKGRNYWGICPFHEDTNPSMSVSPDKQLFKCFVCGTGGDLIKYTSLISKISFGESLSVLAKRIGVEYKASSRKEKTYSESETKIMQVLEDAMLFFQYSLNTPEGKEALEYSDSRGLSQSVREEFAIGYAPKSGLIEYLKNKGHHESTIINASLSNENGGDFFRNRLIFSIKNNDGKIVAFSARDLSGQSSAKYINSAETRVFDKSSTLYNFKNAREQMRQSKEIFINEGFMDVIAMSRAGIKNSLAIMGTSLTAKHINFLNGIKVNLMLDGDKAGVAATVKSIKILLEAGIETYVVNTFEALDPDDILEKHGVEKLQEVVTNKQNALDYIYELHKEKYKDLNPKTIEEFIKSFNKYLTNQTSLTKDFYTSKMIEDLKVSAETVKSLEVHIAKKPTAQVVQKPAKESIEINRRNYSYSLILSMLKNKDFFDLFEKEQVHFIEQILPSIVRYIKNFKSGQYDLPNEEMKLKVAEIKDYNSFVNSPEEFKDLIKRVNKESKELKIEEYKVKLENTSDDDEKILFANRISKLKRDLIKE